VANKTVCMIGMEEDLEEDSEQHHEKPNVSIVMQFASHHLNTTTQLQLAPRYPMVLISLIQ
jgi:hypothetical protein